MLLVQTLSCSRVQTISRGFSFFPLHAQLGLLHSIDLAQCYIVPQNKTIGDTGQILTGCFKSKHNTSIRKRPRGVLNIHQQPGSVMTESNGEVNKSKVSHKLQAAIYVGTPACKLTSLQLNDNITNE